MISASVVNIATVAVLFVLAVIALSISSYTYAKKTNSTSPVPPVDHVFELVDGITGKQSTLDDTTIITTTRRNADFTGVMTSVGNTTAIGNGVITNSMLQFIPPTLTPKAPTVSSYLNGPQNVTYTVPTNPAPMYLRVLMWGGGGGGSGSGSFPDLPLGQAGTDGTLTSFELTEGPIIRAQPGFGGLGATSELSSGQAIGGNGGAVDILHPELIAIIKSQSGQKGWDGSNTVMHNPTVGGQTQVIQAFRVAGGAGGMSPNSFIVSSQSYTDGTLPSIDFGAGAGGGGGGVTLIPGSIVNPTIQTGSGGGAGAFTEFIVNAPLDLSYRVKIGNNGLGGTGSWHAGGQGGSGAMIIYEYYL